MSGSRQQAGAASPSAAHAKPIRLDPDDHAALNRWLASAAVAVNPDNPRRLSGCTSTGGLAGITEIECTLERISRARAGVLLVPLL